MTPRKRRYKGRVREKQLADARKAAAALGLTESDHRLRKALKEFQELALQQYTRVF